jgi:regulator of CtrA degradation
VKQTKSFDKLTALYLSRTYDEAYDLLIEACGFAEHEYRNKRRRDFYGRMIQNRESFRFTSRLAQIVAWLLVQKAYQAGELSTQDLMDEAYRLEGERVCLDWESASEAELPRQLVSLLGRSYDLYCRVQRLDRQFTAN